MRRNKSGRVEVRLEFVRYVMDLTKSISDSYLDPKIKCTICEGEHPQIGVAYRVPCGMCGCWVQFRYLGEIQVPDLSIPISVPRWPEGTKLLNQEENSRNWHRGEEIGRDGGGKVESVVVSEK
jgi:hypothetical protein